MKAIIIIGGYNSLWPAYLGMARDLEDLTGLPTIGVPLMPWDWWIAGRVSNASNILRKVSRTVAWARRKLDADRCILVGHSAGGVIARIYLCDRPICGRTYAGAERTSYLITLGSPHCSQKASQTGWFLTDTANQLVPATPFSGQVCYRTVAGRYLQGSQDGSNHQRRAHRLYTFFNGQGSSWGDGIVPLDCAGLEGAEALVLEGVAHSRRVGRKWYGGSKQIIRRWWPDGASHEH